MKKLILLFIFFISLFFLLHGCGKKETTPQQQTTGKLVKVMTLSDDDAGFYRTYPGRVKADKRALLAFEIPGRLSILNVGEGDKVEQDQLLAQLNPHDYQQRVAQEKAKYDYALVTYQRYQALFESNTVSKAELDQKDAALKIATADLSTAEKALKDTFLRAPFAGFIANRFVDNFEYVQAKQPIVSLQNIENIEIVIYVPEQDISQAQKIEKFDLRQSTKQAIGTVKFATITDKSFPAEVKEFATEADPKTQTYRATLVMKMPEKVIILPGMTANVTIRFKGSSSQKMFMVPIDAVSIDPQGQHFVWRVNEKTHTVKKQRVTLGEAAEDKLQVLSGLQIGDKIVTAGVAYLSDDMKIRIISGKIGK